MLAFFALALDATAHEATVTITLEEEVPEAFFATVMVLDHLVWKVTRLLISNENLLGLKSSQIGDAFIDVPRNELLITSVYFGIGFLNECYPEFILGVTATKDRLA